MLKYLHNILFEFFIAKKINSATIPPQLWSFIIKMLEA
jgi:hypothetical protein